MKNTIRWAVLLLALLLLLTGCANHSPNITENEESPGCSVTLLDVGQGLAVLLEADGHFMLYDGGGRDSSSYVVAYLKERGIESLDLMIASHYDEDHIAGLIGVLNSFSVHTVLCGDYEADSRIYRSFRSALEKTDAEVLHPVRGEDYRVGTAEILVLGPENYGREKENNNSIVVRAVCGAFSCLLTGDAEYEEEQYLLSQGSELRSDLYVVGHHGSAGSSSGALLSAVKPRAVLLSCGKDNDYGMPKEKTMERLRATGAVLYRTDLQGTVKLWVKDGCLYADREPSENWEPGTEKTAVSEPSVSLPEGTKFVINTHSGVFHLPTCESVGKMSEYNGQSTTESAQSLIERGYQPCGSCRPDLTA